ncbi:CoA transferase [Phenylobacterium sp.]|uniref:CoA transferase n=1 Tax=Phenylobacterium sp. TaxID=1871053 RepID=UPI00301C9BC7
MSAIQPALDALCVEVEGASACVGDRVRPQDLGVLDRAGHLVLGPPGGRVSPNGACRLLRAADGWMALNLARDEDHDLIPAWLLTGDVGDAWDLVEAHAAEHPCAALVERAALLGLPASRVGEAAGAPAVRTIWRGDGRAARAGLRVVDLSALWAGPLCGAILAATGGAVTKVESVRRPDPTRATTPGFHRALNGAKADLVLDLATAAGQAILRDRIARADVLITSARPRALPSLGLDADALFAANPGLVWVAITGHGWAGEAGARVAFGDDASAAGGLVGRVGDAPCFLGDALADPVAGLAAAAAALKALADGRAAFLEVSMAGAAASAAVASGLARAA